MLPIMEHMILWFNILGFSLLFASVGVIYVTYFRLHPKWLYPLLIYIGSFAIFSIINSYTFFIKIYVDIPNSMIETISIYMSSFIALLLLWIVPHFIESLFSRKKKTMVHKSIKYLCFSLCNSDVILFNIWRFNK